ncbi:MAG: Verru_Chthon cassette protein D [Verrucomicrobiales bacterium]|nr:Verru_Chthon cassette protein D [Verrucomicrobiales bacterium]
MSAGRGIKKYRRKEENFLGRSAFTLVELLVVTAVLVIFIAVAIPSFRGISQSNSLGNAGRDLADTLNLGRDEAMARNRKVNIRLIKSAGVTGGAARYRAMQVWIAKDDGGEVSALSKVDWLPNGIVISEATALTPILSSTSAQIGTMTVLGEQCNYVSFVIGANGILDGAVSNAESFLTLVREKDVAAVSPNDFFSVFINPATGGVSVYRP